MLRTLLSHWLADPLVRDLDIDDPRLTELRQDLIKRKEFLNRIYREWYGLLFTDVPTGKGQILELGSGAGFLKTLHPEVIQSEIFSVRIYKWYWMAVRCLSPVARLKRS